MMSSSPEPSRRSAGGGVGGLPLLLSPDFRWIYLIFVAFIGLVGIALIYAGGFSLWFWYRGGMEAKMGDRLTSGILYVSGGLLVELVAASIMQLRRYLVRVSKSAVAEISTATLDKIQEEDVDRQYDAISQRREVKARLEFEKNAADAFLLKSFKLSDTAFFGTCTWQFQPGVNILLGRNGYGKSLILRSLAALLQRDEEASRDLFRGSENGSLELVVERNDKRERILRNTNRFVESPGKIPILAIPDSRFVSRMDTAIEAPTDKHLDDALDLRSGGARHFLEDRPYGDMMRLLLNELCFDYLERKSFDQPVFNLLEKAIYSLTADRFEFHAVERVGRNAFRLLVLTEGNRQPLPIQYASQGTLSVLGVVGIIRSYLTALFPDVSDAELLNSPAIVLIDELDAHLHPLWQQKLTGILRSNFPNIQFILTAHSPLVVAGCWIGEAAVLRRGADGLVIRQLDRDFLGTPVEEIYKVVFEVEAIDESSLDSASKALAGISNQERISQLEGLKKKRGLEELEQRELARLFREESMIIRAGEIKEDRKDDQTQILELKAQVEALEDKLEKRQEDGPPSARLV